MLRFSIFIMIATAFAMSSFAQDSSPVLDIDNVQNLQPYSQIDFETLVQQENFSEFDVGWLALSPTGLHSLVVDKSQTIHIFDDAGTLIQSVTPPIIDDLKPRFIDADFATDDRLALVFTYSEFSTIYDVNLTSGDVVSRDIQTNAVAIWQICDDDACTIGLELFDSQTAESKVIVLSEDDMVNTDSELSILPYPPQFDESAVVRIGRIPLPYVITSSLEGDVTLWDIQATESLASATNDVNEPSVFGNINISASHLVWRDNANQDLYLLDLENATNQLVAPLDGAYAQWYFLSPTADVILAVNLGGVPNVYAWDVATGERYDLGEYRECTRPQPDMIRFSDDGTTLAIGCDLGIELWRIGIGN